MKLNEEQIRFINTYLKNSGVKYVDIRYEMTDHVATALEATDGDFDENFRLYMLENKKSLLESNRKFGKTAGRKAMRLLLGNLLRKRFLAVFATIFLVAALMQQIFEIKAILEYFESAYCITIIALIFIYRFYQPVERSKFSMIDKVLGTAIIVEYAAFLMRPDSLLHSDTLIIAYYAGFSAFVIEILFTYKQLANKYKLHYGS